MTTTPDLWRPGFIDNTSVTGNQDQGVVAPTAGNQFFAVWIDDTNFNGGLDTAIARKFDILGNPLTGQVVLSPTIAQDGFVEGSLNPAAVRLPIAGQGDGLAVAMETIFSNADFSNHDIFLRRTDAGLNNLGLTTINNDTNFEEHPSITSFSNGGVWVAYTEHFGATRSDILAGRVDANGTLVGTTTLFGAAGNLFDHSGLTTLVNGNVVAVADHLFAAGDHDIFYTILAQNGNAVVGPTFVNGGSNSPGDEITPHVAALADGGFVVEWADANTNAPGATYNIRAAVYDANGALVAGNILVNVFTPGSPGYSDTSQSDVTALPDGGFIVAWEDVTSGVDRAQRFDEAGNLVGTPVVISNTATFDVDAAAYSDGRSIFTINDFFTNPGNQNDVVSSIWDSRITAANQVTGENFFGPGGGAGDLFLIRDINGVRQLEAIQTDGTATIFGTVGTNQNFVGAGDFNGDGLSDLLINVDNPANQSRTFLVDQMNPGGIQAQVQIAVRGADWIVDATDDFNHNGTDDILVHRDIGGNRTLEVMVMNNNAVVANTTIGVNGTNWQVDGTGDFNGDGTPDILQHQINLNDASMTLRALSMSPNAVQVQSAPTLGVIGANFQVDGTGDFNQDGTSDILVHQDSSAGVRTFQVLTIQNNAVVSATTIAETGTQDLGTTRTDIVYNVVNNEVVSTQTLAVTGIDWHVS
jgi:hypothetical protein